MLLTLLQVKFQNSGNPFQTHGATMVLFIVAIFVYAVALVAINQLTPNTSYLPILRRVCFIFGAFACDLLLLILLAPLGWLILIICVGMSIQLLCDSYQQIFQCFRQIFKSFKQSTSKAFNKFCDWLLNSFQSLCQTARAFNSFSMLTANSIETQVVEMEVVSA